MGSLRSGGIAKKLLRGGGRGARNSVRVSLRAPAPKPTPHVAALPRFADGGFFLAQEGLRGPLGPLSKLFCGWGRGKEHLARRRTSPRKRRPKRARSFTHNFGSILSRFCRVSPPPNRQRLRPAAGLPGQFTRLRPRVVLPRDPRKHRASRALNCVAGSVLLAYCTTTRKAMGPCAFLRVMF